MHPFVKFAYFGKNAELILLFTFLQYVQSYNEVGILQLFFQEVNKSFPVLDDHKENLWKADTYPQYWISSYYPINVFHRGSIAMISYIFFLNEMYIVQI